MSSRLVKTLMVATPFLSSPAVLVYMNVCSRRNIGSLASTPASKTSEEEEKACGGDGIGDDAPTGSTAGGDSASSSRRATRALIREDMDGLKILRALKEQRRKRESISVGDGALAAYRLGILGFGREMVALAKELQSREVSVAVLRAMRARGDHKEALRFLENMHGMGDVEMRNLFLEACVRAKEYTTALSAEAKMDLRTMDSRNIDLVLQACLEANEPADGLAFAETVGFERLSPEGRRKLMGLLARLGRLAEATALVQKGVIPNDDRSRAALVEGLGDVERAEGVLAELMEAAGSVSDEVVKAVAKVNLTHGIPARAEALLGRVESIEPELLARLVIGYTGTGSFDDARRAAFLRGGHVQSAQALASHVQGVADVEEAFAELKQRGWSPDEAAYTNLAVQYSLSVNAGAVAKVVEEMRAKGMRIARSVQRALVRALSLSGRLQEAVWECNGDVPLQLEALVLSGDTVQCLKLLGEGRSFGQYQREVGLLIRELALRGEVRTAMKWWRILRAENYCPATPVANAVLCSLVRTGQYALATEVYDDFCGGGGTCNVNTVGLASEALVHSHPRSDRLDELRAEHSSLVRGRRRAAPDRTPAARETIRSEAAAVATPAAEPAAAESNFESNLLRSFCEAGMVEEAMASLRVARKTLPVELVDHRFFDPVLKMLSRMGKRAEMEELWKEMRATGLQGSVATWDALLFDARAARDTRRAEVYVDQMRKDGMAPSERHLTILCQMFAREGDVDRAWQHWRQLERSVKVFRHPDRIFETIAPVLESAGDASKMKTLMQSFESRHPNRDWQRMRDQRMRVQNSKRP